MVRKYPCGNDDPSRCMQDQLNDWRSIGITWITKQKNAHTHDTCGNFTSPDPIAVRKRSCAVHDQPRNSRQTIMKCVYGTRTVHARIQIPFSDSLSMDKFGMHIARAEAQAQVNKYTNEEAITYKIIAIFGQR